VKIIKIRFTAWRDQSAAPRSPVFQEQLDVWTKRIRELSVAAARIKDEQAHADNELLQDSLARITADLEKIDAERTLLLSIEEAAAEAETRAARKHKKAGTFGYQVLNETGNGVAMILDEAGDYLPAQALYRYEVVDENPPLPEWAKKGTFGH
jgi:hypothetical protein